jgi:hypothetical protein
VIIGAVVPDLITLITESFARISAPSYIYQKRKTVIKHHIVSDIIMIVAFIIVAALCGDKKSIS